MFSLTIRNHVLVSLIISLAYELWLLLNGTKAGEEKGKNGFKFIQSRIHKIPNSPSYMTAGFGSLLSQCIPSGRYPPHTREAYTKGNLQVKYLTYTQSAH